MPSNEFMCSLGVPSAPTKIQKSVTASGQNTKEDANADPSGDVNTLAVNNSPGNTLPTDPVNESNESLPLDAATLLAKWLALGKPEIKLGPGISISNLERWLYAAGDSGVLRAEEGIKVHRTLQ